MLFDIVLFQLSSLFDFLLLYFLRLWFGFSFYFFPRFFAFFLHRRRSRRLGRHYFSCFARDYTLLKSSHIFDKRELHEYGQKSNSWVPNYFWIHTLNRQVEKRWAIHWAELQWRVGFCLTIIHICNWFQLSCAGWKLFLSIMLPCINVTPHNFIMMIFYAIFLLFSFGLLVSVDLFLVEKTAFLLRSYIGW